MSNVIQIILNNKVMKTIIVSAITISFVFLLIVPAIFKDMTIDDGSYKEGDSSNVPYSVANDYIKNVKFGENGIYFEKEEKKDDGTVEKSILTAQDIWNDLIKNGSPVEDYLNTPDELAKLMNAQVVTQFPFLPGLTDDKLNGTVTFERHTVKDDGTEDIKTLEYINQDSFKSMVDSDDMTALNKFTLDDNNNLLIAVKDRSTETVTYNDPEMKLEDYSQSLKEENKQVDNTYSSVTEHVTSRTVNYQNAISKYVMPFQYLWSFLVISDCEDLVMELADLANNSQITIAVFDNITTTETTEINDYKKQRRVDKYASLSVSPTGVIDKSTERYWVPSDNPNYGGYSSNETTDPTNYQITHTSTYETNTPSFEVLHANVWMMELNKQYESAKISNPTVNPPNQLLDTEYKEDEGSPQDSSSNSGLLNDGDAVSFKNEYQNELQKAINAKEKKQNDNLSKAAKANNTTAQTVTHTEASVSVSYVKVNSYTKEIERTKTTNTNTTTSKYTTKVTEKPREKTAKNTDEENFVKILCKPEYINAKTQILNNADWLFEILENNPDTINMIDLTKYLLNKVLEKDKFDTNFSFDEYEKNSFVSVGAVGGSLSLVTPNLEKDKFVEAMKAYAGKNANFDSNFLPYAADIYDWSVAAGVNPELVIVTARGESGFGAKVSGTYNYWGLGTPNGASSGSSYSSLKEGIEAYARSIASFNTGWRAQKINQLAAERQAAGVDPLGYGAPDTLSGMQSLYSDLGKHIEGNSGAGGYYYMDPARAGVTKIYATHEEFLAKCKNSGFPEHAYGTAVTTWENGQYTAWQVESKLKFWNEIFGTFGSISTGGNTNIVEMAKSKLGSPYVLRS